MVHDTRQQILFTCNNKSVERYEGGGKEGDIQFYYSIQHARSADALLTSAIVRLFCNIEALT